MKTIVLIVALSLSVALAGCALANPLRNTSWTLIELDGRPVLEDTSVNLEITDDQLSGRDGCNMYSGPVTVRGTTLEISPALVRTLMACEEPIMEQADAYLAALTSATAYRLEGDRLTLLDANGGPLAVLQATN